MVLVRFVTLAFVGLALLTLGLPSCGNGGGVGGGGVGISGPCGDVGDTGDDDGDGVDNQTDLCCESPAGRPVDADGCPLCGDVGDTGDDDGDGVDNQTDLCCESPAGEPVDEDGCPLPPCPDGDDDADGVCNGVDLCPTTPSKDTEPVDEVGCGIFDACCPCDFEWVSKAEYLTCVANVGDAVVCQEEDVCLLAPEQFEQRCNEKERLRLGRIMRFASESICAS